MLAEEGLLFFGDFLHDIELMSGKAHQAGHLLDGKPLCQIIRTHLSGQTPVFIRQKLAGLCQILERKAIFFDNLHTGSGAVAQRLSALVFNEIKAILCRFLSPHTQSP